jgi:hypothetical protein
MEHEAPAIFVALEQSAFALGIRQSTWLYPLANVGHIVSLLFFVGAVTVMDVRLLGGFAATEPGNVLARARGVAIAAFLGMLITGSMLFAAEASHLVVNPVYQIKMALVAAGLINIAIYELAGKRAVAGLAANAPMPASAKAAGALSLGIWVMVAACGRSIAYF